MTDLSSRQRGCYIGTMIAGVHLRKNSCRESQGVRRQDELIGGIPHSRKVTLTLAVLVMTLANGKPVLYSERAPHINKPATV
jgi:hypothetical protein